MKRILSPKKLLSGLLAGGSTLVLAACYGVTSHEDSYLYGSVMDSRTGQGLPGVEVCAKQGTYSICARTEEGGWYELEVHPGLFNADFELCATDVDGPENGVYEAQCRTIRVDAPASSGEFLLDRREE